MKLFITGSNGFIGSHLVNIALSKGHEVFGLKLPLHKEKIKLSQHPTWISGTLEEDYRHIIEGCDAFIHLAA